MRQAYGSGFASRPGDANGYGGRQGEDYRNAMPSYRTVQQAPQRGNFQERFAEPTMNRGFGGSKGKQKHAGDFDMHERSRAPEKMHGGGHAPKGYGGEKPRGGHAGGGGHFAGHLFGGHHR
jgi:hypothetical protein